MARNLELLSDFADHAAVALTVADGVERSRELRVVADRERIAHDLHDHVIQRLFAAGMDLQGTIARSRSSEVNDRLGRTIDDLQATIDEIRTTIFALQSPTGAGAGFRERIHDVIANLTGHSALETTVRMSGPLSAIGDRLAEQAEPVLMEAISNAVRHSGARHLSVAIIVSDELTIDITDDGRGIPAGNHRHSGLLNMARRAETVGGSCEIGAAAAGGGTRIRWIAPLDDS